MKQEKIFINCPYDKKYKPLFFALIYICQFYEYEPIFAADEGSSSDRMGIIVDCMKKSKYSIHDISRIESKNPRFNMPFELGMYYMHMHENAKEKKMLVLEGKANISDITLSDLSGTEIKCHNNKLEDLFKAVRPFFIQLKKDKKDSASKMYEDYLVKCLYEIEVKAKDNGFKSYLDLDFSEFKGYVKDYYSNNR